MERLLPALVRIQTRRDDTLSLARLAGEAGLSARHFHRLFCRLVGETPRHYCERLRLDHAAFYLRVLRSTILEVALDCGFRNHETFIRAFRRQFGTTPRDYRRSGLLESVPAAGLQGVGALQQGYELSPTVVREVQAVPVGFVRHVGPYEAMSVDCWTRLQAWARARGWGDEAPLFGIAHDAPGITPPARLRFDAAMRVPRAFTPDGEVGFKRLVPATSGLPPTSAPMRRWRRRIARCSDASGPCGATRRRDSPVWRRTTPHSSMRTTSSTRPTSGSL